MLARSHNSIAPWTLARLDIINDPLGRLQYAAMDERLIRPEPKF